MEASEAGELIKIWAAQNGFISKERFAAPFDDLLGGADLAEVPLGAGAVQVFHGRGINLIGFNDANREVVVFTSKRVTKKERAGLPQEIGDGITISYQQGNVGSAGSPPGQPFGQGAYYIHNGRYTCGSSITHGSVISTGTMGCLVRDQQFLYGLSCNHVTGLCNFADPGIPIVAPGSQDVRPGGCDPFTIGYHHSLLPQLDGIPQNVPIVDNTDAAIFRIRDGGLVSSMQRNHYDTPAAVAQIQPGMVVEKVGRTSGRTSGRVRAQAVGPEPITYLLSVLPGSYKMVFYNPIFIVEGIGCVFAENGDSGSLVTTDINGARHAVGILSGVNSQAKLTYILPIGPILARLNVQLANGHNV